MKALFELMFALIVFAGTMALIAVAFWLGLDLIYECKRVSVSDIMMHPCNPARFLFDN